MIDAYRPFVADVVVSPHGFGHVDVTVVVKTFLQFFRSALYVAEVGEDNLAV